ncbi:hypothetical protein Tco_0262233 [Tanacetum coccineum]
MKLGKRSGIAIAKTWEDLKKLLKEEFWDHVMIGVDVDNSWRTSLRKPKTVEDHEGLSPSREVEFHIDLIYGAMPVATLTYHLAPTELQELSNQLKELQEKGFMRPSSSPWGAPSLV